MPMGEQMLLVEAGLWKAGCHSGPDRALENRAGTAPVTDLLGEERSHEGKISGQTFFHPPKSLWQ